MCSSEEVAEGRRNMQLTLEIGEGPGSSLDSEPDHAAGLRAEVGEWENKKEARQCVRCSEGGEENAEMHSI